MAINSNTLAASVGVSLQNKSFTPSVSLLERKMAIIGTYDPGKTLVVDNEAVLVTSANDVADQFGLGEPVHRMAIKAFQNVSGVPIYIIPQSEEGGAAAATGTIVVTASSVLAGTISLYIAGDLVQIAVTAGQSATQIGDSIVTAISNDTSLPVTASNATGTVTITAKSASTYGNFITLSVNQSSGEVLPSGVTLAITAMSGGSTDPDIADALDATQLNQDWFTDIVFSYQTTTAQLDALSNYNGPGDQLVGLYASDVFRPFQAAIGDNATGSAGFTAAKAVGDGRKTDRTTGGISVPGSPNHPSDIAAAAQAQFATLGVLNSSQGASDSVGRVLIGIIPGKVSAASDRWTADPGLRDQAVKFGYSPTILEGGSIVLQNGVTFYHPDSVADANNGYRFRANLSKIWNITNNIRVNFQGTNWQGFIVVDDIAKAVSNEKARDANGVRADLIGLTDIFETNAWLFQAQFTKENLTVSIRANGTGFDSVYPIILSGVGGIINMSILFDTSLAAFV